MSDINRRINKIEKHLNVGKEPNVEYIIIHLPYPEGTTPYDPESYREWQTFKAEEEKAKQIAEECGLGIVGFYVDPFKEYEVRHNLPEGFLSKHKHAGKVPFYLLKKITKIDQIEQNSNRPRGIELNY